MNHRRDRKIAFFIDDDSDFLELLPEVIQHPHFEVQTYCAFNGYRTIDEVIKIKPDVLFIDFYLPRANGGQILPILKSIEMLERLPIYLVTGYSKEEIMPFLKDVQFSGIVFKDNTLKEEIIRILNQLDDQLSSSQPR